MPVDVLLRDSVATDHVRAGVIPSDVVQLGDRLRFAEPAAGNVCLLGTLEAEVAAIEGDSVVLHFAFSDPVLSEMLALLAPPETGSAAP